MPPRSSRWAGPRCVRRDGVAVPGRRYGGVPVTRSKAAPGGGPGALQPTGRRARRTTPALSASRNGRLPGRAHLPQREFPDAAHQRGQRGGLGLGPGDVGNLLEERHQRLRAPPRRLGLQLGARHVDVELGQAEAQEIEAVLQRLVIPSARLFTAAGARHVASLPPPRRGGQGWGSDRRAQEACGFGAGVPDDRSERAAAVGREPVPPGTLDRVHGRRELAERAPHEILGSLRAARVRGAVDQLPRLLHEPSDGGRDALPAARLELEARRQARGDGVVAERVVAAPAGARARVHRAAVPVVAGAGRAGGALGRPCRGGAAGRARGRRAARRARRGRRRRGQGAVAPAAARDVVAVRGAAVAGAVAARAVGLGATGSAAVAPADAGRCAEVALLVRPDQAVAAALGPALARVEGAVGATGERAAAEAERDAGGAAEVRAVAVLARLDAGHGATGGGARTFARASRGHAHLAGPRARAAAVAVLERLDLAVAARGAWREGRVREQRERWLEDGIGRDALVDAVGERARAVGQRRD